jgi:glycosyltransferase involved in cell wall biosynthesis
MAKCIPNILIFIDWFIPAYKAGGPIQSVLNMVQQLNSSFHFYIVTSDSDLDGALDIPEKDKNKWQDKENYHVMYLDKAHQTSQTYKEIFKERKFEVVYLNSLFSSRFSLLPLRIFSAQKTKIVLAPRGMLGKGALSIKPFKKKVFLNVFKLLGWHKKVTWHATAETERKEIQNTFSKSVLIQVASNLSKKCRSEIQQKQKTVNKLNVFFLSRISYKKNLLTALKVLGTIDKKYAIKFNIIGPVEDEAYWKACENEIKQLPAHIETTSLGAQPNENLEEILKDQHILLLPTRNENFGHVIVESWQNGCPVIISDQTPWSALEDKKIGLELPLNKEDQYKTKIEQFAAMNKLEFNEWSTNSKNKATQITNDKTLIEQYKKLFSVKK